MHLGSLLDSTCASPPRFRLGTRRGIASSLFKLSYLGWSSFFLDLFLHPIIDFMFWYHLWFRYCTSIKTKCAKGENIQSSLQKSTRVISIKHSWIIRQFVYLLNCYGISTPRAVHFLHKTFCAMRPAVRDAIMGLMILADDFIKRGLSNDTFVAPLRVEGCSKGVDGPKNGSDGDYDKDEDHVSNQGGGHYFGDQDCAISARPLMSANPCAAKPAPSESQGSGDVTQFLCDEYCSGGKDMAKESVRMHGEPRYPGSLRTR